MDYNRNNNFKRDFKQNNKNEEKKYEWTFKNGLCTGEYLKENLITEEAKNIAKDFKNEKLSASQLRAFFGEIKALKTRILDVEDNKREDEFKKVYPLILIIKSKINYRYEKEKNKLNALKQFLDMGIELIQKENKNGKGCKTFLDFALFFEVVVGYFGNKD